MSAFKFGVVLNLSNYFSDFRHRARICIDDRIKTVKDLQDKITAIFDVKNFILTSRNEYLPHTEDIRILHSDDIIWVIPSGNSHIPEDNSVNTSVNTTANIESKVDKKRKQSILNNHEDICLEDNVLDEIVNDELQINIKKKKKKHSVDIESETKIKKHKKKHKDHESDAEESQNLRKKIKSSDYTQEKTKDFVSKNVSFPVENPYVNQAPTINVATSTPFSIPCKKAASVSTNTNKYLKQNKINIVKIDYIKRPNSELKQNGEADATTCQTQIEEVEEAKSSENNVTDLLNKDNQSNNEAVEELPKEEVKSSFVDKKTNKISLYVPTTKYFFLNTPSNETRVKTKPAKKRENFFKLKEGLFSPVANKYNTVDDSEQIDLNKNEMSSQTNTVSTSQIAIDNTKMSQEENFAVDENTVSEHDQQITEEDATTEIDKKSDGDISMVISEASAGHKEVMGKLTRSILEDSCYIDKTSPCDATLFDNSEINYDTSSISGVTPFSFSSSKKRYVSGVGQLLTSLRESETNCTLDKEPNSDSSEFVTKRRRRTRKRQKKSNNSMEETTTFKPTPQVTGAIKPFTVPKIHIKFSEKDNSEVMEQTEEYSGYNECTNICNKTDANKNESSVVCKVNGSDYMKSLEESVHQLPIMSQKLPNIGDVISFKVLKISDDFTPGISSNIVGNVTQFSPESKVVTFKITTGIEQLQAPKGKFSLDQEDDYSSSSDLKDLLWADLIEPKLLYP